MKLRDYYINIPKLASNPLIGKYFSPGKMVSPKPEPVVEEKYPDPFQMAMEQSMKPTPSQAPAPQMTKQQIKTAAKLYDAAQEIGKVYEMDPRNFLANSKWEHRGTKSWENGQFNSNVWWDNNRNTGEESYGPYQINMRYFGPKAIELGRITQDHPLYITPEQAMDPYESTKWQAKKWQREMKAGIKDWGRLFQLHNSNEKDRSLNVQKLIDENDFVRGEL